jgi:tetratricopeptide (TPR) repeat protein
MENDKHARATRKRILSAKKPPCRGYTPIQKMVFVFAFTVSALIGFLPKQAYCDSDLESAILSGKWGAVLQELNGQSVDSNAVDKMILGHACLALNHNNQAFCLFLSLTEEDLTRWQQWSTDFAAKNPGAAVAHYFRGDALARLERWGSAVAEFKTALTLDTAHWLSLNARGACHAAKEQWSLAIVDFDAAIRAASGFADAYASRGTLNLKARSGAEGALKWFNRALEIAPDFALAFHGRGSAELLQGHWEAAQLAFAKSIEEAPCGEGIVAEHARKLAEYMSGNPADQSDGFASENGGTTLDRRFSAMTNDPSQWNVNRFVSGLRGQPLEVQNHYIGRLQELASQNPQRVGAINQGLTTVRNWDRPTGPGSFFSRLIPTSLEVATPRGGGSIAGVDLHGHQLDVTSGNFDVAGRLQSGLGMSSYGGGVAVDFSAANLDLGDWPIVSQFGLLYQVRSHSSLSTEGTYSK